MSCYVTPVTLRMLWLPSSPRHDSWDCHRTADQARGGARGVNGAAYMAVPWSVWELFRENHVGFLQRAPLLTLLRVLGQHAGTRRGRPRAMSAMSAERSGLGSFYRALFLQRKHLQGSTLPATNMEVQKPPVCIGKWYSKAMPSTAIIVPRSVDGGKNPRLKPSPKLVCQLFGMGMCLCAFE